MIPNHYHPEGVRRGFGEGADLKLNTFEITPIRKINLVLKINKITSYILFHYLSKYDQNRK